MKGRQGFQKEIGEIYRLKVPFESVYTSVFLIKSDHQNVLVDCATTAQDVKEYIVPALEKIGAPIERINTIVLTHSHGDHAGGLPAILQRNPAIQVIHSTQGKLKNGLTMYEMKGHTLDCIGVFDEKTGTLISGDGLQGHGIGKYGCGIEDKVKYLQTLERIKTDERIKNILFSHAYEPWNKDVAFGREEVLSKIQDCEKFIKKEIEK